MLSSRKHNGAIANGTGNFLWCEYLCISQHTRPTIHGSNDYQWRASGMSGKHGFELQSIGQLGICTSALSALSAGGIKILNFEGMGILLRKRHSLFCPQLSYSEAKEEGEQQPAQGTGSSQRWIFKDNFQKRYLFQQQSSYAKTINSKNELESRWGGLTKAEMDTKATVPLQGLLYLLLRWHPKPLTVTVLAQLA